MRLPILDQFTCGEPEPMPMIFASMAVISCALAVIVVFLTVYGPVIVRDVRSWYRARKVEFERSDRARLSVAARTGDRRVW